MYSSTQRLRGTPGPLRVLPGAEIRDYTVLSMLGEGGMGKVYRARHALLGTEHALKMPLLDSPDQRYRFIQEARVSGGLQHPFINRATDLFEWEGQLCMISDLVVGQPIDAWARRTRPTLSERCKVLFGVAQALEHAHQAHVLHRDLTPSNVYVSLLDGQPRLLDFGACMDLEAIVALTQTGLVLGKIGFLAPELLDGARPSVRSDIFQLALLMRMVIDPETDAFARGDERERLRGGLMGTLNPMSEGVPAEIRQVISGGLAREPSFRPASSAALGQALMAALEAGQRRTAWQPPSALCALGDGGAQHTLVMALLGEQSADTGDVHAAEERDTPAAPGWADAVRSASGPWRDALHRLLPALLFLSCFVLGVLAALSLR